MYRLLDRFLFFWGCGYRGRFGRPGRGESNDVHGRFPAVTMKGVRTFILSAVLMVPPVADTAARQARENAIAVADNRLEADVSSAPWNAVAKVQTNIGTKCTGVLVAPRAVLTAAHCLFNRRTQALLEPGSVHVLFGFRRETYRWHGLVSRIAVAAGFDGRRPGLRPDADWARLELGAAPPVEPLRLAQRTPPANSPVVLAGFGQDRNELLLAEKCEAVGTLAVNTHLLLAHDCTAPHGTSGAPLLVREPDGWRVAALNIGRIDARPFAIPAETVSDEAGAARPQPADGLSNGEPR